MAHSHTRLQYFETACSLGYNEFDFFKTHLLNNVFDFWRRFLRVWLQRLKKVLHDQKHFLNKTKKVSKNAEFHADFKSIGKVFKKCTKKVISKTSLTNMSKRGKNAYFRHVFANIFLMVHFLKTFSTDLTSA
jgi:hypothetical protein